MATAEKWDSGSKITSLHCTATRHDSNVQNGTRKTNFPFTRSLSDGELDKMKELARALKLFPELRRRSVFSIAPIIHHRDHIIDVVMPLPIDHHTSVSRNIPKREIVIMKYLVPTLLALVGIKYQPAPDNLFLGHAIQIVCFAGSLCLYWPIVIIVGEYWSHLNHKIIVMLNRITVVCNYVSVLALMSVLLPHHLSLPLFAASVGFGILLAVIVVVCLCLIRRRNKVSMASSQKSSPV